MTQTTSEPYRSVWQYLARTPFHHGWIVAGGVKTRYLEAGKPSSPVLIMLHGTGGSLDTFCANIGPLAAHFHVFAIDMIGSGFSAKPDHDYLIADYVRHVRDFMDAKILMHASIMGVSLGSWVAARFSLAHPERTNKLVLLSPSGMISNPETLKRMRSSRTQAVDDPTWDNVHAVMARLVHDSENVIDDHVAIRQSAYKQPEMKAAMKHILALQTPDIREQNLLHESEWRAIKAKMLVIASIEDKGDYLKTAYCIGEINPNATVIDMPNVNHWPHFENPEEFNAIAIEFLND